MVKEEKIKLKLMDEAWLGLDEIDDSNLFIPTDFLKPNSPDFQLRLSYLLSRPEYFSLLCKEILNIQLLPMQCLFLEEMWQRKFPMLIATRGFGKSFGLSLYAMLRALLLNGRKIVVVGSAFRQSKILFEYMETIWRNSPLLRSMCDERSGPKQQIDRCIMRINDSIITCLPLGDGQKIRGQRANDIIADEFASIPRDIFENVVAGFAVVSSSPIDNVKRKAAEKAAKKYGFVIEEEQVIAGKQKIANQIILSGTAYYEFNHFAEYWKKWKAIINSKGEPHKIKELFKGEEPPETFDWTQYSIIRIPYELVPDGFMDADQVARSKATVHKGIYQMEFGAVFTKDSQGFFKRSLIESCVPSLDNIIRDSNNEPITFEPMLIGDSNKKYIFAVDPASEVDNFSIVLLEFNPGHRKIVHVWTTTRSQHKEFQRSGASMETDFYAFCARKIRDLKKRFNCIRISMDAQGGGIAVMEALHDKDKLQEGELPIWPIIDPDEPADTDDERGLHILEMCQFANYEWLREANHGMKKDFEDKVLIFPSFDGASIGLSVIDDNLKGRTYDTLEDCILDIEELKTELSVIEMTQTPSGKDKWDTPEVIIGTGRKKKIRKDRYSALLMANMAARVLERTPEALAYNFYGGFANTKAYPKKGEKPGELFNGPNWFTDAMKGIY
jgi:hypothetical protein